MLLFKIQIYKTNCLIKKICQKRKKIPTRQANFIPKNLQGVINEKKKLH